jgi:hypothetical protein
MCDDDWIPTTERITPEQVEALNKLLAMPWREADFDCFEDDED